MQGRLTLKQLLRDDALALSGELSPSTRRLILDDSKLITQPKRSRKKISKKVSESKKKKYRRGAD